MIKIDVGCGWNPIEGFIGIDKSSLVGAEHVLDVEKERLPFGDGAVDEIYCSHFLEHIDDIIYVMNEFWRVLKWDGRLQINVPHWDSTLAVQDPTHKRSFSEESFKFFCGEYLIKYQLDYGIRACFEKVSIRVSHKNDHRDGNSGVAYNRMIYARLRKNKEHYSKCAGSFPFTTDCLFLKPTQPSTIIGGGSHIAVEKKPGGSPHIDRFKSHLAEVLNVKLDATKRYGSAPAPLGSRGLFADINRKTTRLKKFLWDGEQHTSESLKDTCYDLAVYAILTIMAQEDER